MSRIVDEDVHHIKTRHATDAYREGWERVFGEPEAAPEPDDGARAICDKPLVLPEAMSDGIECAVRYWMWHCPVCKALVSDPENHWIHGVFRIDEA